MTKKTYKVGKKIYTQEELTFGGLLDLLDVLPKTPFPPGGMYMAIMHLRSEGCLEKAVACCLRDKNGESPSPEELKTLPSTVVLEIVSDFFTVNPILSWAGMITKAMIALTPQETSES